MTFETENARLRALVEELTQAKRRVEDDTLAVAERFKNERGAALEALEEAQGKLEAVLQYVDGLGWEQPWQKLVRHDLDRILRDSKEGNDA